MSVHPRKALLASGNYWTSPMQAGSHHIARGLAKRGWEVAYISDPISPWHLLGGVDLGPRAAIYRQGGLRDCDGRLWSYVPAALAVPANRPLLRSGWVHRWWQRLSIPNVVRLVRRQGFGEVDLLLMDSFSQPFWLEALQAGCSVFRVADQLSHYPKSTPVARAAQAQIAAAVDVVAYTAQTLEPYIQSLHPKRALHFPNGLNFQHFTGERQPCPEEYRTLPRPVVVYVGALDVWFDSELVVQTAERLPQVSFVLIGPSEQIERRIKRLPNLHLLGRRAYAQIPAYLQHADVGMIPFAVEQYPELVHGVHPLKLYEYLACGLPVVAVSWQELETLGAPVYLSRNPDQFAQSILQAAGDRGGEAERVAFAAQADWGQRLEAFLAELGLEE
jgi:glycosyltransferase involved in cell wall biosynthesis